MEERSATTEAVQCGICHLQGATSYTCRQCVCSYLQKHWEQLKVIAAERDQLAAQANQVLSPKIKRYQMCLAQRAMAAEHAAAIAEERRQLLQGLEQDRQRLQRLRTTLNQRKELLKLSVARLQVTKMNGPPAIASSVSHIKEHWASVHQKLVHSRRVLVAELVTLFDLKCVPERKRDSANYDLNQSTLSTTTTLVGTSSTSSNSKSGSRKTKLRVRDYLEEDSWNEYLIVGRPLPTGYFENYDRDAINTTIENVIHMMTLVTCYLGIKLPYDTFTRQSRYYIQAATTAGSKRTPLFLSENNLMLFAAGLGYLNYNIAYLCHSQGIHIPLENVANTLENLLACCEAPNLGRYTNYASLMAARSSTVTETESMDGTSPSSPISDDHGFENISSDLKSSSKKHSEWNEHLLWCPGQEPFNLNVHELIAMIRSRREEESPVWGGLHLQDAVAANMETLEDDYFMHEDQEEEDGMYALEDANNVNPMSEVSAGIESGPGSTTSTASLTSTVTPIPSNESSSTINPHRQRRPAHPSRDRRQSHPDYDKSNSLQSRSSDPSIPTNRSQTQPENWTFLDIDTYRVPSSVNKGSGLLPSRWPDMGILRKVGSAVGGAAVGLVNGASNVAGATVAGKGSRIGNESPAQAHISGNNSSYPAI